MGKARSAESLLEGFEKIVDRGDFYMVYTAIYTAYTYTYTAICAAKQSEAVYAV